MSLLKEAYTEYKTEIKNHKAVSAGLAVFLGLCALGAFEANCNEQDELILENPEIERIDDSPDSGMIPLEYGVETEFI